MRPLTEGRPTSIEKVLALVPDGPICMQMRNPNLHSLIGPNSTVCVLSGHCGAALIGR